jgi:hypothetical protein
MPPDLDKPNEPGTAPPETAAAPKPATDLAEPSPRRPPEEEVDPKADEAAASMGHGTIPAARNRTAAAQAGVDRAGVDRAGVDRAGADRAGADRAGVDRAGVDRAGVDRAGADRAGADRTGADRAAVDWTAAARAAEPGTGRTGAGSIATQPAAFAEHGANPAGHDRAGAAQAGERGASRTAFAGHGTNPGGPDDAGAAYAAEPGPTEAGNTASQPAASADHGANSVGRDRVEADRAGESAAGRVDAVPERGTNPPGRHRAETAQAGEPGARRTAGHGANPAGHDHAGAAQAAEPGPAGAGSTATQSAVFAEGGTKSHAADQGANSAGHGLAKADRATNPGEAPAAPERGTNPPGRHRAKADQATNPSEADPADHDDLLDETHAYPDEGQTYSNETHRPEEDPWDGEPPTHVSTFAKIRAYTLLTLGPLITGYIGIVILLATVTGMASSAKLTTAGILIAALPGWLAAHQVPIEIFGPELGVLPLLPTIGVAAVTARAAARAAARLDLRRPRQAGLVIGAVAITHAIAGVVVAGLTRGAAVTADPLAALYTPALIAALAATMGVARRCGLGRAIARRADVVAVEGLRAGAFGLVLLLTAGGVILTFGLLTSIDAVKALFPMGIGNAAGMLLLSIGYLPNAMVAATSFAAGPGFSLGTVTVSPLEFHGGRVPGVPLLAAVPEHLASWWPAFFVFPLAVGIAVGRRLRYVDEDPVVRLRAVAIATGIIAISFLVLAGIAGGRLGRGPFDPVGMPGAALSIALVLWTAVPGGITAWFSGPRYAIEPMPGLIEPEDEVPEPRDAVEESGEVVRD